MNPINSLFNHERSSGAMSVRQRELINSDETLLRNTTGRSPANRTNSASSFFKFPT